ncbi:hypothetical protein [Absidia glauca]|uniref:FYVE-type domain-containing protein n=1 Tax=Absidia glauca TaxID=4829 RepID=A0A168LHE5_ABSGL|nr:hypothetical protein [Absidia glauca]
MDIYALTRKRRPSRLTMGQTQSDRSLVSTTTEPEDPGQLILAVTGPPTKFHWKYDEDVAYCAYSGCSKWFGLFTRRHHCRKCGDIFCSLHCSNYLRLNQDSEFHPQGFLSRGCDDCADKWKQPALVSTTSSTTSTTDLDDKSEEEEDEGGNEERKGKTRRNRHAGIMTTLQPHALEGVLELGRDDIVEHDNNEHGNKVGKGVNIGSKKTEGGFNTVALSVPADWHWSTF